jgi:hypothetical protein
MHSLATVAKALQVIHHTCAAVLYSGVRCPVGSPPQSSPPKSLSEPDPVYEDCSVASVGFATPLVDRDLRVFKTPSLRSTCWAVGWAVTNWDGC